MSIQRRRGFIPGGSEQLNRYRILRQHQQRQILDNINHNASTRNDDEESSSSDHSLEADPDYEIEKVVDLVRSFTNDLYLALREKHPTNLVYSPLGFCISSILIRLGCNGLANAEISRALFPKKSDEDEEDGSEVVIGLSALVQNLEDESESVTFKHTHRIFMDCNHKPRKTYKALIKTLSTGGVDIEEIDFCNLDSEVSATKINRWAHEAGGKMLGDVLTRRSAGRTKMIFINPIFFEGSWVYPFNPALTQEEKFFVTEKQSVNVPMMSSGILKNLLYSPLNKLGCTAIVLPYQGNRLGLAIFLPNVMGNLTHIESNLEHISPANYIEEMQTFRKKLSPSSGVRVHIPKFRIDCTIDFQGPMKEMGIETAFQSGKADFSGLAHISAKDLHITEILQKVVLQVNEMGSDAIPERFKKSNLSSEGRGDGQEETKISADGYSEIIEFRVNQPFYFQVIDMKSDLILLAGACRNPEYGKDFGFKEFLKKYDIEPISTQLPPAGQVKTWSANPSEK